MRKLLKQISIVVISALIAFFIAVPDSFAAIPIEMPWHGCVAVPADGNNKTISDIYSKVPLKDAVVGVLAMTVGGDTIMCHNPSLMMLPASDMKTVTTAVALDALGPWYRFETKIGYSGEILDGALKGDLYIIGGGDPTLGSDNPIARSSEEIFGLWKQIVEKAGISRIEGHIIGDSRIFTGMAEHPSWQYDDIGTYYGTGTSGLSFYENRIDFEVTPGSAEGEPITMIQKKPLTPWMTVRQDCSTGKAGTGNTLYFYTSDLAPVGVMRGTFALDRKKKTEKTANKFPAYTCASYFVDFLSLNGIECSLGAADTGPIFGYESIVSQDSLTIIGSTYSPYLKDIIKETNTESNNLYAETLFRTLGYELSEKTDYKSCRTAVYRILDKIGVGPDGIEMTDGSGLSRRNYASPDFFCRLLSKMTAHKDFGIYLNSFPCPGRGGTLKGMMCDYPVSVTGRIRMKSGSMSGVRCFCGYVIPTDKSAEDIIVFSVMVNNFTAKTTEIQPIIDNIILSIAGNCD